MRVISLKMIWDEIIGKKKLFLIGLCIVALLGMVVEIVSLKYGSESSSTIDENLLQQYEAQCASKSEEVELQQQLYQNQEKFCLESPAMKMDATAYYNGQIQCAYENYGQWAYVASAMHEYVMGAEFWDEFAQVLGDEAIYARDLTSTSQNGSGMVFEVTVRHYDGEICAQMLDIAEAAISKKLVDLYPVYGEAYLDTTAKSVALMSNPDFLSWQSQQWDQLAQYKQAVENATEEYDEAVVEKEEYVSANAGSGSRDIGKKQLLKKLVLAAIAIVILYLLVWVLVIVLRIICKPEILSTDYFKAQGISVISRAGDWKEILAADMDKYCSFRNIGTVTLVDLSAINHADEEWVQAETLLQEKNLKLTRWSKEASELELIDTLKAESAVVLLVQLGKTTYSQMDGISEKTKRYGVGIAGVVIE